MDIGSNPHSKGEDFSWFNIFFFERAIFRVIKIKGKIIKIEEINTIDKII